MDESVSSQNDEVKSFAAVNHTITFTLISLWWPQMTHLTFVRLFHPEYTLSIGTSLSSLSSGSVPSSLEPSHPPTASPQAQFLCAAMLPCLPLGKEMSQCKYIRPLPAPWLITLTQKHQWGRGERVEGGRGGGGRRSDSRGWSWMFIIIRTTFFQLWLLFNHSPVVLFQQF